ncbi:SURF1 family cytochrome oxidase biogenesis protein [Streptomyces orinoci]|uniref:SURF1-like protein n=1 Tax=Streptomyces orinoci TaxID=67339 RepID=A0ABV3JXG7_STRON|nr:SURF1 family protein [Streptomyces orinoci]
MYRFLLTRQWVILTLVGLVLIPVMIKLGFWQLHRHESRVARNHQIGRQLSAAPVPVTELSSPGRDVSGKDVWRRVSATGSYDPKDEVVVRYRTDDSGKSGFMVVTPLMLADGKAVLVNRGWIPADSGQLQYPKVPAPPSGKVTITGRLRADETTHSSGIKDTKGLPPRMVMLINSRRQSEQLHRPLLGGYIELAEAPSGSDQPEPVSAPDHSSIGNHMAYAVQWWLFSAFVPVGWVILVRRERRDQQAAAAKKAEEAEQAAAPAAAAPSTAD